MSSASTLNIWKGFCDRVFEDTPDTRDYRLRAVDQMYDFTSPVFEQHARNLDLNPRRILESILNNPEGISATQLVSFAFLLPALLLTQDDVRQVNELLDETYTEAPEHSERQLWMIVFDAMLCAIGTASTTPTPGGNEVAFPSKLSRQWLLSRCEIGHRRWLLHQV